MNVLTLENFPLSGLQLFEDFSEKQIYIGSEYVHQIGEWEGKSPFKKHLHVPENHPTTGVRFEREDEGHVFKVKHEFYS